MDNLLTHSYEVTATNQKTGVVKNEYKAFSEYYKGQIPDPLELPVKSLQSATTYNVSVRAIDAYDNTSENTLSTTLATHADDATGLQNLVEQFEENDKFENQQTAHTLKIHLSTVNHYKDQGLLEKAIKHMEGFKSLLKHQKNNEDISEQTYHFFKTNADHLLETWQ